MLTYNETKTGLFINLTQHETSAEQVAEVERKGYAPLQFTSIERTAVRSMLTFESLPSKGEVQLAANALANIVKELANARDASLQETAVMIGGAPYLMGPLTETLKMLGVSVYFSFSQRVSEEHVNEAGETIKTNVFKHVGFVEA